MRVDVVGDSIPLNLLPRFTDAVSDLSGRAAGRFAVRGTLRRPTLVGAVALSNAAVRINPLGIDVREINGAVRMAGDTVTIDSLVGRSKGTIRLSGGLGVGNWREPSFNLFLVANDAEVMDTERGFLHVDAGLRLTGPFRDPYASGQVTVLHGVIYSPSGGQKRLRSEEHTSELQSRQYLVCRLLLEKKNNRNSARKKNTKLLKLTSTIPPYIYAPTSSELPSLNELKQFRDMMTIPLISSHSNCSHMF